MNKYIIKEYDKDFVFMYDVETNTKGTRKKKAAYDKTEDAKAYFKYEKYNCSESCSEKMCYEIAKILGYKCAKIELAKDADGVIGILNYSFINTSEGEHHDAKEYLSVGNDSLSDYHNIENIKLFLDKFNTNLFKDFLKIMVFDALVGETDRHSENWGITKDKNGISISCLYDNGCNLVRYFKNEIFAQKYYDEIKEFDSYIKNGDSCIYDSITKKKYNLFDLIKKLYKEYPELIFNEIQNLNKLTDTEIENIVYKIPDGLLTKLHKQYIIRFLKERKKILFSIVME